jgi:transcriptional regulator with XRE-family HTH domain
LFVGLFVCWCKGTKIFCLNKFILCFLQKFSIKHKKTLFSMDGLRLKTLITSEGYTVAQIATLIGTSQQNLSAALKHADVRTGLVEKIAEVMGKPLAFFYGESYGTIQTATGNNNTQVAGTANVVSGPADALLDLLKIKDEQLLLAMRQTSTAQEHTSKAQEQMDRLLDKIVGK